MTISIPEGSVEYLNVDITADVTLDTQPVSVAVSRSTPTGTDWQAAEWAGTAGTTRTARVLYTADTPGLYAVWARITDNPETPIIRAGTLSVS